MSTAPDTPAAPPVAGIPPQAAAAAEPIAPAAESVPVIPEEPAEPVRTAEERLLESIMSDPRAETGPDETAVDDTFPPESFAAPAEEDDESPPEDEPARGEEPATSGPVWDRRGAVTDPLHEAVATLRAEADATICGLEARLREAQAELQSTRAEGRQVTADRDDLVQRLELAAVEFDRLHRELDEARQQAEAAQAALTSAQAAQAEAHTTAQAAVQAAQEQADAARRERDAAVASAARPAAEERRVRVELAGLEETVRQIQAERVMEARHLRVRVGAGAAALALIAGALGYAVGRAGPLFQPAPLPELPYAASNATPGGAIASMRPLTATVVRVVQPPGPAVPVWPSIRDARLTVREEPGALVILFNEPLFSRGIDLAPDARQDLRRLAALLKPYTTGYRIEVEGHADASRVTGGQAYASNRELGLTRARAAADVLAKEGGLPVASLSVSSTGDASPLVPGDTPEARRRNRTVVIKLHAARSQ